MASSPNAGGSDYGLKVYGNSDTQMSELNSGNLIHMNKPNESMMSGGRRHKGKGSRRHKRKGSRRGGLGLTEFLVPAGLVLSSNYMHGRSRSKTGRRGKFRPFSRYRRGGGATGPAASFYGGVNPIVKGGGDIPEPKMGGTDGPPKYGGETVLPKYGGETVLPPSTGGSTFVDLALPAGFVYANDRYYNRKNRGVTNGRRGRRRSSRRGRGSRRGRR